MNKRPGFIALLLLLITLLGMASSVQAGEFCSSFPDPVIPSDGLIDGDDPATLARFVNENITQITIDTNCTFRNWPASNPLDVTINFQTNDPSIYLIVFDNVEYTGNMACANVDHKLWFVNGSTFNFSSSCQDLFIPVEAISKKVPDGKTTVGIGESFTYTLTIPVLYDPATGTVISETGTNVDVHSVNIYDDLNQTGADLTFVSSNVTYNGNPLTHSFNETTGVLTYDLDPFIIPTGDQVLIEITVVPDTTNTVGTQFFNTAEWSFGRVISLDPDGDGIFEDVFFDPLPGENGVSEILTIGAPELAMTKSSLDTTLSPGAIGTFTLDVQNTGTSAAWEATIVDRLPETATASMCGTDPTTLSPVTAAIYEANGTTLVSTLTAGVDYTASFSGSPTCELTLVMAGNQSVIDVDQRLIITYQAQLDPSASVNGEVLTNVAGATQWFSGDGAWPRNTSTENLSNGTPAVTDHEDSFDVTVGLAGYYFQKTVSNLESGENPATTAQAGDTLRYRLRIFNVNQNVNGVEITDQLDLTRLDAGSFQLVSAPGAASVNFNAGTGLLTIDGGAGSLDVAQGTELVVEFDIDTLSTLVNNDVVSNQALLTSTSGNDVESDDPFINGVDDPQDLIDEADPTDVIIQQPGALTKTNGPASAVIGEAFTYTITLPESPVATTLYDVRILDSLGVDGTGSTTAADVSFVSAVDAGGSWTLTNTGTASSPVIEDLNSGIDIPAGTQAVITMTVRLDNTATNQAGLQFYNTASYTYNRTNGVSSTQTDGGSVITTTPTTIFEPSISATKTADNATPTAGDVVHYTITMTAASGANISDVFDVTLVDIMSLGLEYVPNSATVSTGLGVGSNNTVSSTDVTGDGITTPQTLTWGVADVDIDVQAGDTVTLEYDALVRDEVLANTVLNNTIVAQWTSTEGANGFERDGSDGAGGAVNDYATEPDSAVLTTPDINTTINKVRSDDTFGAGDDDVRIGDIVEYTLTIPTPEGTLGNLQLVDTLPQGLDFAEIVSINGDTVAPYSAGATFTYSDIPGANIVETGDPVTGPTTVTWTLGNVTNQPNDGQPDDFVIVYRARVLDNVLAQVNSISLNNTIEMLYDKASSTVTTSDVDTRIDVLQPDLSLTKSAVPAGGDILIDAGEVITYTVDIINEGTAPAYDTVLQDIIPTGLRQGGVTTTGITRVNTATNTVTATLANFAPAYNAATGTATWDFDSGVADAYTIPVGETLRIEYEVQADAGIAQGLTLTNAATATLYYSFDDEAVPTAGTVSGTREIYGPTNTASTTLFTGSPPTKTLVSPPPASPEAAIGETIVYEITVPGTASASTLYDVQITDALDTNLELVSANVTGGTGVVDSSTASAMNISIDEISAGSQAVIELTTRVKNVLTAQQGVSIDNAVDYAYAFSPGGASQPALTSTNSVTVSIIEPDLAVTKNVTAVTPAPVTGGDVLEYELVITNGGTSEAFDVNIMDTLPPGLTLDGSFTPTAAIDAVPVTGFVTAPSGAPGGPLVWGRDNADGSLDIPAGSTLVLTYRVLIDATVESNVTLTNSVLADWTSLDDASAAERDGSDGVGGLNDYISPAATTDTVTSDNNSLAKTVTADSYAPANDSTLRVGDTVTYELSLNLQEGTTRSVAVDDVLPVGMAFVGIVSINGDTTADYTPPASGTGSNFSYAAIAAGALPVPGQTGTLTFTLGDVVNDPLGNANTDSLIIVYQARVVEDTLSHVPSTTLTNTATLGYIDGAGNPVVDPARLESSAAIDVLQPVMTVPAKVDSLFTSPASIDVVNDTMQFTLESCNNTGLAPAYDVQLTDDLPDQLDENTISGPTNGAGQPDVYINGALAIEGTGYTYTPPSTPGGSMIFDLATPVDPGNCVTVRYDIGFYTNFGPNQVFNNSVTVDEYWSLPSASGQQYGPLGPTIFIMSNGAVIGAPTKTMLTPAGGEATIGEDVVYRIQVPPTATNAALYDVVISDTLHPALEYVGSVDTSGNGLSVTDNTSGNNVSLTIALIPAGQQAVIEVTARVANNTSANANTSFDNTTSYTYATTSGGATTPGGSATTASSLLITEPLVTLGKAVTNLTSPGNPPTAGDVLQYSLTLPAAGGAGGDAFSDAFDVGIVDDLSLGLAYQSGTAVVSGAGNTITDPAIVGDGIATPQTLTWQLADATADIDIAEGSTVTITYDVLVLNNVLSGQPLSNSAVARWTGIDDENANERDGSGTPAVNDYFTVPATTTQTMQDNTTLSKTRLTDTYGSGDSNVRIGDIVEYELSAVLQEGQTDELVFTDTLPQGLAFEEVVQINGDTSAPFSAVAPFSHNDVNPVVSGDPLTGPSTVTFNVGDVTNAGDNNPANDTFVIVYRARLLDNVFPQVNNTGLSNSVQLDYTTGSGPQTLNDTSGITLLQPALTVSKTAVAAGGNTVIDAGELVTYTVDVENTGTAPAYDTVLQDIIPVGMRDGAATITMVSTTLVIAGTVLPNPAPVYDPATGVATWNLDTGAANAYTIPVGETLRIVYQVQADDDLGAGLTLTNQAVATTYYSFDDDATPVLGGVTGVPEIYGPSNTAGTTLTSPTPGDLQKDNPADLTVSVGETFTYSITVPASPLNIALHDVRIIDDLAASAADLGLVSVARNFGTQPWTPVNTGSATNLVIEDTTTGIDIPAGEQVIVDVTVRVEDTSTNISGLLFNNTASYTYNQLPNDDTTRQTGGSDTTGDMTIVGPDNLTLEKSGPAQMRIGIPGTFTLDVHNTGTAAAWDVTITDRLPNLTTGGMCDTAPTNVTARIYLANGVTPVSAPLVQGTDYSVAFAGAPTCTLTVTMESAAAALPEDNRLIVTYEAELDVDTPPTTSLTNVAGATEWFSADTAGSGATGATRTYQETISNGSVGTLDHEDAHTVTSEAPVISVQKSVVNVSSGQNPGSDAQPGDTMRYSIRIENVSPVDLPDFRFIDDLDALNATPAYAAGTLTLISVPGGAVTTGTDPNGGSKGTGLVDVDNLTLGVAGSPGDTVQIVYEITLASVIDSGTLVLNQGQIEAIGVNQSSDDPNVNGPDDPAVLGDEDPTQTLITSAPVLEVFKTSLDLTGDPNVLVSGDTLRYTITVNNIGDEDTVNATLQDQLPANTTYVSSSTTLNGAPVADASGGLLPLQNGILINAPSTGTPGFVPADATAAAANSVTVTFDVIINDNLVNGTVISNQGFVSAEGAGSGTVPDKPSDDPATSTPDDPTRDIVGNAPLLDAHKTVTIITDNGSPGIVDPLDVLRYTITISNTGASPANGVIFTDAVPANTTYQANTAMLNGIEVGLPGSTISPLVNGIDVSSSDLTPPLPTSGNGTLTPGEEAVITFDVEVNAGVASGTIISNQGSVDSDALPPELTDADGIDGNGDQPTEVVVGNAQLLSITKQVTVVGGGTALAGGQLEYRIRVTNTGLVPATEIMITDDLDLPVPGQLSYVSGSGLMQGSPAGVTVAGSTITADYQGIYGSLPSGESAELRFIARINSTLPVGTTIINMAEVSWNTPPDTATASVSIDTGGTPGVANLNGTLWHDVNYNNVLDAGETLLQDWVVDVYRGTQLLGTFTTDSNGVYTFTGLAPNDVGNVPYELRFRAPGAGSNTAMLGLADSPYTDDLQQVLDIIVSSGDNIQDVNLPIDPNGVVYDAVVRTPVPGATLTLLNASNGNAPVPTGCFDDPAQQNQVTLAGGHYKFDMNFSDPACSPGDTYVIEVIPPGSGFVGTTSLIIPPSRAPPDPAFSVETCPGSVDDQLTTSPDHCEIQASVLPPPTSASPRSNETTYYLHFTLGDSTDPYTSQIFNNHIPIDPELDDAVSISKTSALMNVTRGQLVPYTITLSNSLAAPLTDLDIIDSFPAGFKYVAESARIDGIASEPVINGLQMSWEDVALGGGETREVKMLLVVGSGVGEGEYVNRVQALNNRTGEPASGLASATVRVIPDPTFDCSDVIGKVFDDSNMNGYQDQGEVGIAQARVISARGIEAKTDAHGRFHITCAVVPNENRGSNFILKLDERSLPSGYRMTTENPRVQRATRGKMLKFNFGAAIHRVVRLDMADAVFEPDSARMRSQWVPRVSLLMEKLVEAPSILRLTYMADTESRSLVEDRLDSVKDEIEQRWENLDCCYQLEIETEIFWRRGRPASKDVFDD